ncbi:DUF2336 domain-containing protein [Methylobacterium gregans]|uniref:DUF2336 domain-containing protein n=1 Tax=Methylobacterium gregans TaxID=374424 RepID=A0AA37HRU4_9HYPH|nr:DUF2336 domain-containing protein [Methylobacterium gregans]MDQ0524166.1 uncharacterized protein (DUF2336 family) [Methylobacterium gregans]GJD80561.1 hypothetical protein NBEOAGPD_3802 [Methylobacterium gregans]GLS56267.1 hypothetical protein GCM10007886_44520 [Methylobacterium gregans]
MIIRQFLASTQHTSAGHRAEAASALARAFLYGNLAPEAAWEAKTAILALLDDPAPIVRRALAEACAASARAPRPLIVALASDQTEVACLVLARSPVLTDADLVDAAAMGCEAVRTAIAGRHHLSHAVAGALAEIAGPDTLAVLARNPTARITTGRMLRMVERHGAAPVVREALLARPDLPIEVRHAVGARLAHDLERFATGCGWLSPERGARMSREAGERAVLDLCAGAGPAATARVVRHLRATGQLNAGLILRAILSGAVAFAETAFTDLTQLEPARVAALMREPRGIAELHRRAGLAEALLPAVTAALGAWREAQDGATAARGAGLSRRMIERALTACEDMAFGEMQAVMALLTRFEAEAARDEAREVARAIAEEALAREATRRASRDEGAAWDAAQSAAKAAVRTAPTPPIPVAPDPEPLPEAPQDAVAPALAPDQEAAMPPSADALDAVLDALPGAILASFREEQERLREEAARAGAEVSEEGGEGPERLAA